MSKVSQRIELFERVRIRGLSDRPRYRRIAILPNADDELEEFLKLKYPKPNFYIRIVTEIFSSQNEELPW